MASPLSTPSFPNRLIRIVYPRVANGDLVPADPSSVDLAVPPVVFGSIPNIVIDRPPAQIARLLNNLHAQGFRLYLDFLQHGGEGRFSYQTILLGLSSQSSILANIEAFANTLLSPEGGIFQASASPSLSEITAGLNSILHPMVLESLRYSTSGSYSGLQSPEFTSSDSPSQQPPMGWGRVASSFLPHGGQDQLPLYNLASDLESGGGFLSPYDMSPDLRREGGFFSFYNMSPDLRSEEGFFSPYNISRNHRSGEGFFSPYTRNLRTGGALFPTRLHPQNGEASSQPTSMDTENGSGGNGGAQQLQSPSMMTETFMVVTAEVGLALLTVMSGSKNNLSTNEKILLYSAGACNVGGFVCSLGATLKLAGMPWGPIASKTMAAIAKVATSYGFLAVMGTLLPDELMLWVTIPGAVVLLLPFSYAFIKN